jgi:hypothetical protein
LCSSPIVVPIYEYSFVEASAIGKLLAVGLHRHRDREKFLFPARVQPVFSGAHICANPFDLSICIRYCNATGAAEHSKRSVWINPEGVEDACSDKSRPANSGPTVDSDRLTRPQQLLNPREQPIEFQQVTWHAAIRNWK